MGSKGHLSLYTSLLQRLLEEAYHAVTWKVKSQLLKSSVVHFTGFVSPEELVAYYAATDIYVHPASIEPHSIAISEAIYMGCPVVISDRCGSYGVSDDVQADRNGLVFPFGDYRAMTACIRSLQDAYLRKKFSEHSHREALRFQKRSHDEVLGELKHRLLS